MNVNVLQRPIVDFMMLERQRKHVKILLDLPSYVSNGKRLQKKEKLKRKVPCQNSVG